MVNAMNINKNLMETQKKPKVLGTGLIALDVVLGYDGTTPFIQTGGTCGNVLTILSFLNWNSIPIARLSNDLASQMVINDLKQWNVSLEFANTETGVNTPIIIQTIKKNKSGKVVHRFSFNCPMCGAWLPSFKPVLAKSAQRVVEQLNDDIDVFFFDRVSRSSLILAKACSERGAIVVFEPISVGDIKLFKEALAIADILKYSNERFSKSPIDDFTSKSCLLEIQTLGSEGLRYRAALPNICNRDWEVLDACKLNEVKDTAGAGDWCTAGIIDYLGKGGIKNLKDLTQTKLFESLKVGQALGSWNCQFEGARGGMYKSICEENKLSLNDIIDLQPERQNDISVSSKGNESLENYYLNNNISCQTLEFSSEICCA